MTAGRRKVSIGKGFFKQERDGFYSDWKIAFWRELFQNSVDAGAQNIQIYLEQKEGRGSFDAYRENPPNVVRVVFIDDGCGMSFDVLDDVYFAIGNTTKKDDGGSVGGFGRARAMTCFSQDRYSILTKDNFVMGEGGDFDIWSLEEALTNLKSFEEKVKSGSDQEDGAENTSLQGLWRDQEMIVHAKENGGYNGCRVEIDLDTERDPTYSFSQPASLANMQHALRAYLSESQIKPKVTINGQEPEAYFEVAERLETETSVADRKGSLSIEHEDRISEFAEIYVAKKRHDVDGDTKLIVRVSGASMYSTTISSMKGVDVVVEIDPKQSRMVLNSNRDGMNASYRRVLNAFTQQLATDVNSALMEKEGKKQIVVKGEHGTFESRPKSPSEILSSESLNGLFANPFMTTAKKEISQLQSVSQLRKAGISYDMVDTLIRSIKYHEGPLSELPWQMDYGPMRTALVEFMEKVRNRPYADETADEIFLDLCPAELRPWLVDAVVERVEKSREEFKLAHENRLKDIHDVRISIISMSDKTKAAIKRNHPDNWDRKKGTGKVPHMLLSAWNTALAIAIEAMFEVRPKAEAIKWRSGWVYQVPEMTWDGDTSRPRHIGAIHQKCQVDNTTHELLLNPVDTDGKIAYSLSDDRDLWRIIVLAVHETAHIIHQNHNEAFVNLVDDINRSIYPADAIRRVRASVKATGALYGAVKHQALDNEPGPRPVERLQAQQATMITKRTIAEESDPGLSEVGLKSFG